jgi:hypothetical protein
VNKQNLKNNIKERLEALTGWTAYDGSGDGGVPSNATFPYIIYRIGHGDSLFRNRMDRNLYIEFWTDISNVSLLDEKSDIVRKGKYEDDILVEPGLDESYGDEGNDGFYACRHDWEDYIPTGENNLNRFDQRYILHVF